MRTSFHHQPEAQHPIFQVSTSWQADYPIFRDCSRWSLTPMFQILALSEGAPNSEERPSSCPPVELATWPSDDHCSRLVFITKNTREAQVRGLFDAARMLTTDATGPKR